MNRTRDIFKPQSLLGQCKKYFTNTLKELAPRRKNNFSLADIAMSGLAMFHLKVSVQATAYGVKEGAPIRF